MDAIYYLVPAGAVVLIAVAFIVVRRMQGQPAEAHNPHGEA